MKLTFDKLNEYDYLHTSLLSGYVNNHRKGKSYYRWLLESNPRLEDRPYQYELAALYATRGLDICAGGQGLGKTIISAITLLITFSDNLKDLPPGSIHIIVPALLYAKSRWVVDFQKFTQFTDLIEVVSSEKQIVKSKAPIWVYDMNFPKRKSKTLKDKARPFMSRLLKQKAGNLEYLIVDECHHFLKGSDRSKHLAILRRGAKRVLFLSGTLTDGRLDVMHFLLRLVYGRNWRTSERQFLAEFQTTSKAKSNYLTGEEELSDVPNRYLSHLSVFKIPDYAALLQNKVHRVTLDNSFVKSVVQLPTPNKQVEIIKMEPDHAEKYKDLVRQRIGEIQACRTYGNSAVAQAKALKVIQPLIECSNFPEEFYPKKLQRLVELVEEFSAKGLKTVIFNNYVSSGWVVSQALRKHFGENKIVRMYAEDERENPRKLKSDDRAQVLSKFSYDSEVIASVFAIRLSGESIDLTEASAVIFYDIGWDAIKLEQATSRVVRPGAVNSFVELRYLAHQNTIDQHMLSLYKQKQAQMDLLLDFAPEYTTQAQRINVLDVLDLVLSDL